MKYLLIIQICSSITQTCTEPSVFNTLYSSYYNCATGGFINSMNVIKEIGEQEVNKNKIFISFKCKPLDSA